MPNVFAIPVFFIVFRETLETSIIVAILLSFLKSQLHLEQDRLTHKKLTRQVWWGTAIGLVICLILGCGLIGAFYGLGKDHWTNTEHIWEGVFALVASIIISIMGVGLLRVSKLQEKWRKKIGNALDSNESPMGLTMSSRIKLWGEKYAMFLLPFVTVLREGLEAVVFVGGVSFTLPATSIPLPTVIGLIAGSAVGYLIYRGGNVAPIQAFLIISTCFLYLVGAGLFSKAVGHFEMHEWNKIVGGDAAETGAGPGSYDYRKSVWHVNCCSPYIYADGGWGVFNSLFGWTNSATYGTVISYNMYWIAVIVVFLAMIYYEKKGHWPLLKPADSESEIQTVVGVSSHDAVLQSSTVAK